MTSEPLEDTLDEEQDRRVEPFQPCFPDPRSVVGRMHISGLRNALGNQCPFCRASALELLDETTFEVRCADCGRRATRYALADAALYDPTALERILEPYDGLWDLLADEGRWVQ